MELWRVLVSSLLLVAVVCADKRLLRRKHGRLGDESPYIDTSTCRFDQTFYVALSGEKTSQNGGMDFMVPSPNLIQHREKLLYTDEMVEEYRANAEKFFMEFAGVDFTHAKLDETTGGKSIECFHYFPVMNEMGTVIVYTSDLGTLPCAQRFGDEGFIMRTTCPDQKIHGSFGGEAGVLLGPMENIAFGHYAWDLDQDGIFEEEVHFYSASPMRVSSGLQRIDCNLYSNVRGAGSNEGKFDMLTPGANDQPHLSLRSVITFPRRFDFGVQYN